MVIVDDYTGMYFVYFLKHKSESLDYFSEFQKKFENRLETKIKSIRTDNGREFINESFRQHLNKLLALNKALAIKRSCHIIHKAMGKWKGRIGCY